jgi:tRNA modification GTPase
MTQLHKEIVKNAKKLINADDSSDIIISNQRHRDCLLKSCEYLVNAKTLILQGGGNELISFEIRAAMDAVSEIIGKTANVDILNNIFTKFCIGK